MRGGGGGGGVDQFQFAAREEQSVDNASARVPVRVDSGYPSPPSVVCCQEGFSWWPSTVVCAISVNSHYGICKPGAKTGFSYFVALLDWSQWSISR